MENIVQQAIKALEIDVPVLNWTVQNNKVTLLLYGGQVRTWEKEDQNIETQTAKKHEEGVKKRLKREGREEH